MSEVVPPFKKVFSASSPHMANSLYETIQDDIDTSERNRTVCLKCFHVFTITLPNLTEYPDGFRHFYLLNIVDADIRQDLQDNKIINWCRSAKTLYPLKTKGDGNCLLHSVSLCMWGLEDDNLLLRRILYVSLVQDTGAQKNFKRRWLLHQRRLNQERPSGFSTQLDTMETDREWETITNAAIDTENRDAFLRFDTLEAVHLYVLANILRRPIIVLANKTVRSVYGNHVQDCNLSGIYLPLEWKSQDIFQSPILLGYSMNHFVPLVTKQPSDRDDVGELIVPLVLSDLTPLIVQFMLPEEEPIVQDLLKMYLKTKYIPMTTQGSVLQIPVAKLEPQTIQDHHNLVQDHLSECLQIYGFWAKDPSRFTQAQGPPIFVDDETRYVNEETGTIICQHKCLNEECEMYGTPSIAGYCNKCFMDYTKEYKKNEDYQAALHRNNMQPSAPPASFTGQAYQMSMMEQQCKIKCGNRASTKTYPFCHECNPQHVGHPPPSLPISLQETGTKGNNDPIDDFSLFGGGNSRTPPGSGHHHCLGNSFSKLQPGELHRECASLNCRENCLTLQANKCAKCFITTGHTDFQNQSRPSSRLSEAIGGRSSPSSQTYLMNDLSAARNPPGLRSYNPDDLRCKTQNCPNSPHYHLGGVCTECAKNQKQKTKPPSSVRTSDHREDKVVQTSFVTTTPSGKNICMTPGCEKPIAEGGLCYQCINIARHRSNSVEFDPENLILSATPCPVPTAEEVNPVITSHKDKIKCASPLCQSLIYPPNKMCDHCTAILSEAHARSRSTEHRRLSPVQQGACYSPSRQRCKTTGCQYYGDQRTNGYCSKCYEKDKKNKMRPLTKNSERGRICVEPGCDKYGDASMHYRCTFHFNVFRDLYANSSETTNRPVSNVPTNTIRSAPVVSNRTTQQVYNSGLHGATGHRTQSVTFPMLPSQVERFNVAEREPLNDLSRPSGSTPGVEQKYNQAMSKVERERRTNTHCKNAHCANFGNSQKEGYCNSCYPEVLRKRLTEGSGNNSPQYGDSYCC